MPVSLVGNTLLGILWRLKRRKKFYSHPCAVCTDSELQLGLSSCFWGFASSLNYRGNTQNPLAAVRNAVCQCGLRSATQITAVGMAGYHAQPIPVSATRDLSRLSHSSLVSATGRAPLAWLQQAGSSGSSPASAAVGTSAGFQADKSWLKRCKPARPYTLLSCDPQGLFQFATSTLRWCSHIASLEA